MNGEELIQFIELFPSISNKFLGIYSINTLPKKIPLKHFLISNTAFDSEPGSHWISFLRQNKSSVECFDSLGLDSEKQTLISKQCKFINIKFNHNEFQSIESKDCGKFVLYYLINRMHNLDLSFTEFLQEYFYENKDKNNSVVVDFFNSF